MKKSITLLFLLFYFSAFAYEPDVCFTPGQDCEGLVVSEITKATGTIDVQAYYFTSDRISDALIDAASRGVYIRVLLDKSQKSMRFPAEKNLMGNDKIFVKIDSAHAISHNKVIVINHIEVITGSFNFTKAAQQRNAENLLVIKDPILGKFYEDNFSKHWKHSKGR